MKATTDLIKDIHNDGADIIMNVFPYMGYIGMCGPKGYGFSAALVINRV